MPEWLFPALLGLFATLVGVIWRIGVSRQEAFETRSQERFDAIEAKLGTSDQAVQGQRVRVLEEEVQSFRDFRHNEYNNRISQMLIDIRTMQKITEGLEQEVDNLRGWRHETVDPYIPRAVDALKERIDRLDRKVFNGHRGEER